MLERGEDKMKYVVTFQLRKRKSVRRVATKDGHISRFKTKHSALRRAKEYKGLNPRIMKVKWM